MLKKIYSPVKRTKVTAKKSFFFILKIVFLLFSLQFLRDAFYKWDGYSYHMRFIDFLPYLSLAFILWTIIGVIITVTAWLIIYVLFKITSKFLIPIRLEHIIIFFILIVVPLFIKRTFFGSVFSISELIGTNRTIVILIGVISVTVLIWFARKYAEKILSDLNAHITPLAWLFVVMFILALSISIILKRGPAHGEYVASSNTRVAFEEKKRPNIILVILDTLTVRDMQMYGYERPTTPFISKWAKDTVVFNRAYASSNWTTPSVMSLMTGQRPWTHKVWYRAERHPHYNYYENNFPAVLKDYGYNNYAFVQNRSAHPETLGIANTFIRKDKAHTFHLSSTWWMDKLAGLFINNVIVIEWIFEMNPIARQLNVYSPDINITMVPPENVYNRFLEYIYQSQIRQGNRRHTSEIHNTINQPFFAWLHVFPPHDPYLPPKPYMGVFGDIGEFNTVKKQKESKLLYMYYGPERQADVDIFRTRFDEFILYSDKQFELFLLRLYENIDISNTIIIFTSDHGEIFSHGYLGHDGPHLYEPLVNVPLIIKMPEKINSRVKEINMPVEQIDIAPTILELAGIPIPAWIEGRSLLPLLKGEDIEPRPVFSMQLIKNRSFGHPITKGSIAVWERDYKLIHYLEDEKSLLFNLRSDPDEIRNIFNEEPEIAERMGKSIYSNLSKANERLVQSYEK